MIDPLGTNAHTAIMQVDDALSATLQRALAVLSSSIVAGEVEHDFRHGNRSAATRQQLNHRVAGLSAFPNRHA